MSEVTTFQRFPQPFNFPSHWTGRGFKSKHLLMASYPHKTKKAGHQRPSAPPASRYSLVFKAFSYAKLKSPQPIVSSTEDFRGPSDWIRTSGLLNPIQARYQTSPHPENAGLCVGQLMYNTTLEKKKQPLFEKIFKLGGTPFAGAPPGRFTLWAAGWKTGYRPGSPCSVAPVPPDTSPWSEPA